MSSLNVDLILPRGSRIEGNELPDDLKSEALIAHLMEECILPRVTPSGKAIVYWLEIANQGKKISRDETLADAGVIAGDVLYLRSSHKFQVYKAATGANAGEVVEGELLPSPAPNKGTEVMPAPDSRKEPAPLPEPASSFMRKYRAPMLVALGILLGAAAALALRSRPGEVEVQAQNASPVRETIAAVLPSPAPESVATPTPEPISDDAPLPSRRALPRPRTTIREEMPILLASTEKKKCGFWRRAFVGCKNRTQDNVANTGTGESKGIGGAVKSSAIDRGKYGIDSAIGSQVDRVIRP